MALMSPWVIAFCILSISSSKPGKSRSSMSSMATGKRFMPQPRDVFSQAWAGRPSLAANQSLACCNVGFDDMGQPDLTKSINVYHREGKISSGSPGCIDQYTP